MSKSIREDIIRKAEENLAKREAERQRAITGEIEKVYVEVPKPEPKTQKFNPEKFAVRLILSAGFVWAVNWALYNFVYKPDVNGQRLTVVAFLLIPIYGIMAYVGYLIIRIVAKSYWEFVGCAWLITLMIGVLGLAGLVGSILMG